MTDHRLHHDRDTLTLAELARRLGMSMTVAYERARLDALPIPRIPGTGRRYVYSRRAYEALMRAQHGDSDIATNDAGKPGPVSHAPQRSTYRR